MNWRLAEPADLDAIETIAAKVHPDYPEDRAIFAERLALFPRGCHLFEHLGIPEGYILSHPWTFGDIPKLNHLLATLPAAPTTYYLHDLALLPETRGLGAGTKIVATLAELAKTMGLDNLSLAAVNHSVPFWEKLDFRALDRPDLVAALASYDADARFMVRRL